MRLASHDSEGGLNVILDLLAFLLFAGITWAVASEGAWGAALVLIEVTFAALIATSFWQPIAGFLSAQSPEWRFWWQYVVLMFLFIGVLATIRAVSGALSPRMPRFPTLVEQAGRWLLAACAAWVFLGFFYMSLHMAPLAREFLGFEPERRSFVGTAPDRHWLGFMYRTSRDVFDRSGNTHVFDPQGLFLPSYASWRESYEDPEIIEAKITAEEFQPNAP